MHRNCEYISSSGLVCGSGAFRRPVKGFPRGALEASEARMLT